MRTTVAVDQAETLHHCSDDALIKEILERQFRQGKLIATAHVWVNGIGHGPGGYALMYFGPA